MKIDKISKKKFMKLSKEEQVGKVIQATVLSSIYKGAWMTDRYVTTQKITELINHLIKIDHDVFGASYEHTFEDLKKELIGKIECECILKCTPEEWKREALT